MRDTDKILFAGIGTLSALTFALYGAGLLLDRLHGSTGTPGQQWLWLTLRGQPDRAFTTGPAWLYWLVAALILIAEIALITVVWRLWKTSTPKKLKSVGGYLTFKNSRVHWHLLSCKFG